MLNNVLCSFPLRPSSNLPHVPMGFSTNEAIQDLLEGITHDKSLGTLSLLCFSSVVWHVWKKRNLRIFMEKLEEYIVKKISSRISFLGKRISKPIIVDN